MEDGPRLMIFRLALWGLALFLLGKGGHGLYVALENRTPQSVTCAEAENARPTRAWLSLTGCSVNLMDAAFKTKNGARTGEVLVPLTSTGSNRTRTMHFVVATQDPEIVNILTQLSAIENDKGRLTAFVAKNRDRIVRDRDVRGLVHSWFDRSDRIEQQLRTANENLSPDFVVVDEGREPSLLVATLTLAGAVVIVVLLRTVLKAES